MEKEDLKKEERITNTKMDFNFTKPEKNEPPKKNKMTLKKFIYIAKKNTRVQIALIICLILLLLIALLLVKGIKTMAYHATDEYKLTKMGYTLEESQKMIESCDDETIKLILKHDYNGTIDDFVLQKFFMWENLDRYLEAKMADTSGKMYSDIIAEVNVNRDRELYTDMSATDISLNELMLVNKYFNLSENFEPVELTAIPLSYAYEEIKLSNVALEAFEEMCDACKSQKGYTIVATVAYRTYSRQSEIWQEYKDEYGMDYADLVAARAGSSEHQTGLAVNIAEFENPSDLDDIPALYKWLLENAHKYGFIQRYPEGKENITGYKEPEPSHFRYVGVEAATIMYNLDITFDEYYAFFIQGGHTLPGVDTNITSGDVDSSLENSEGEDTQSDVNEG